MQGNHLLDIIGCGNSGVSETSRKLPHSTPSPGSQEECTLRQSHSRIPRHHEATSNGLNQSGLFLGLPLGMKWAGRGTYNSSVAMVYLPGDHHGSLRQVSTLFNLPAKVLSLQHLLQRSCRRFTLHHSSQSYLTPRSTPQPWLSLIESRITNSGQQTKSRSGQAFATMSLTNTLRATTFSTSTIASVKGAARTALATSSTSLARVNKAIRHPRPRLILP